MNRALLNLFLLGVLINVAQAQTQFFPNRVFSNSKSGSDQIAQRYTSFLRALDEPSVWELSKIKGLRIYRFLWLRSAHAPTSIRLTINQEGTGTLIVKMTDGRSGDGPGSLVSAEIVKLTATDINVLLDGIRRADFWNLPTSDGRDGIGGAQWLLEGADEGKYHVVDRWSPKEGPFRDLALLLVRLAKLDAKFVY